MFMLSRISICFFIVCSICAIPRSFHPKSYKYSPVLSSSTFKALFFTFKASGIYLGKRWHFFSPKGYPVAPIAFNKLFYSTRYKIPCNRV